MSRLEAKSSLSILCVIKAKNVFSDSPNVFSVTVSGQLLGWKPQPKWDLHLGQVATVHENPGYQEKRWSAGQCFVTSALLNVITSNSSPWGFSKSWTWIVRPPTDVSLRVDSAIRLGTKWMSVPNANSCPHALHSICVSVLVPCSGGSVAHESEWWKNGSTNAIKWNKLPHCDLIAVSQIWAKASR